MAYIDLSIVGVVLGILSVPAGIIVWLVRLEGHVKNHDTLFEERKERDAERYDTLVRDIASLRRLIERRFNSRESGGGTEVG